MQSLVEGRMDIGVMYTPQSRPGLKVEQLFEEAHPGFNGSEWQT